MKLFKRIPNFLASGLSKLSYGDLRPSKLNLIIISLSLISLLLKFKLSSLVSIFLIKSTSFFFHLYKYLN